MKMVMMAMMLWPVGLDARDERDIFRSMEATAGEGTLRLHSYFICLCSIGSEDVSQLLKDECDPGRKQDDEKSCSSDAGKREQLRSQVLKRPTAKNPNPNPKHQHLHLNAAVIHRSCQTSRAVKCFTNRS